MTTIIDKFPGSVDVSSNLSVDSTTLFVDTVSNNIGIGKTDPSEKLDVYGTIKATGLVINDQESYIKPGLIIAYYSDTLPNGWNWCDGNNGTPNLNNRFIRGAVNDSQILQTGGWNTKAPDRRPKHNHNVNVIGNGPHTHSGSTDSSGYHAHNIYPNVDNSNASTGWFLADSPGGDEQIFYTKYSGYASPVGHGHAVNMPATGSHNHNWNVTGYSPSISNVNVEPKFKYLRFIMKI
jgi:hypothetical protein